MIEITKLTMDFGGVRALNDLTVTLDDSVVGIIGLNGAGKTALLNVLSGLVIGVRSVSLERLLNWNRSLKFCRPPIWVICIQERK